MNALRSLDLEHVKCHRYFAIILCAILKGPPQETSFCKAL